MDTLAEQLEALALATRHGFGFLCAYGVAWWVAAVLWSRVGPRVGAVAALVQGMVALPIALGVTDLVGSGPRPDAPLPAALSIHLASGQLVMLPVAGLLIARRRYLFSTVLMAVVVAVHFAPYSWLYGTLLYAVVAVVIGLGTAVLLGRQGAVEHADEGAHARSTGARVCALVGTAMLAGAVVAWFL